MHKNTFAIKYESDDKLSDDDLTKLLDAVHTALKPLKPWRLSFRYDWWEEK